MRDICYLDMDGVLVDIAHGVREAHGQEMVDVIQSGGFIDEKEIFQWLNEQWWIDLPPTDDFLDILKLCQMRFGPDNVVICTKPTSKEYPAVFSGKLQWLAKHMPFYADRYIFTRDKSMIAGPRKWLVDDNEDNVDRFTAAGGKGILLPREWNRNRGKSTTLYLRYQLWEHVTKLMGFQP